jgi:hypothetical protein
MLLLNVGRLKKLSEQDYLVDNEKSEWLHVVLLSALAWYVVRQINRQLG